MLRQYYIMINNQCEKTNRTLRHGCMPLLFQVLLMCHNIRDVAQAPLDLAMWCYTTHTIISTRVPEKPKKAHKIRTATNLSECTQILQSPLLLLLLLLLSLCLTLLQSPRYPQLMVLSFDAAQLC